MMSRERRGLPRARRRPGPRAGGALATAFQLSLDAEHGQAGDDGHRRACDGVPLARDLAGACVDRALVTDTAWPAQKGAAAAAPDALVDDRLPPVVRPLGASPPELAAHTARDAVGHDGAVLRRVELSWATRRGKSARVGMVHSTRRAGRPGDAVLPGSALVPGEAHWAPFAARGGHGALVTELVAGHAAAAVAGARVDAGLPFVPEHAAPPGPSVGAGGHVVRAELRAPRGQRGLGRDASARAERAPPARIPFYSRAPRPPRGRAEQAGDVRLILGRARRCSPRSHPER